MAAALHRRLGWPIGCVVAAPDGRLDRPHITHAYVLAPDGTFFDGAGFLDGVGLRQEFFDGRPNGRTEFESAKFLQFHDEATYTAAFKRFFGNDKLFAQYVDSHYMPAVIEAGADADSYVLPRHQTQLNILARMPPMQAHPPSDLILDALHKTLQSPHHLGLAKIPAMSTGFCRSGGAQWHFRLELQELRADNARHDHWALSP